MNSQDQHVSLTERSYWEDTWQSVELPKPVDLSDRSLRSHANMVFHRYFSDILQTAGVQNGRLVEIGCAQSKWLPYFAKIHGFTVTGLDYTAIGCARASELLRRAGCQGEIVQGDMFNPPENMKARYDVVLSFGLVEHFPDTAGAIRACAALAKPAGLIMTVIPNMVGIIGMGQRWLDRIIYYKHVPLDGEALRAAHEKCGLGVLQCGYLMSANFAVINHSNLRPQIVNKLARGMLIAATAAVWVVERMGIRVTPTRFLSPYVVCVARNPSAP
jgi:2-polyprenyl-3-methyl-5-hydroxy-6-metoxy-1,4-benzoquinol methylase